MFYKAKVAVCSEIRTKQVKQCGHHVDFLNINPLKTKLCLFYITTQRVLRCKHSPLRL
jgi:hypothetical protein